jgi:hypothetical protein
VSIGPSGRLDPGHTERHRTDFTVFTEAGAAFFDGRDPYRVANPRGWHYLYPPLFALLIAPLSIFDTESQVVVWYAVNVVLTFGCFGEGRRLYRLVCGTKARRYLWVAGLACLTVFLPFLDCMQAGQLGIGILYLLMLGFRLTVQQSRLRWFVGGLILAFPSVVKLVPAFPVAFLLLNRYWAPADPRSGRRPWAQSVILTSGVAVGILLFLLAVPASLIGWRANFRYLNDWRDRVVMNDRVGPRSNFNIHSFRNQSLANALYLWDKTITGVLQPSSHGTPLRDRPDRIAHPAARILVGLVVASLLLLSWTLRRRDDIIDRATTYGMACCAMLIVSPLSWGHYFVAELPAVLLVPIWLLRHGLPRLARIVAVFPAVISWSYYVAMPYTGGFGLLGLGTTVWFLGVCGIVISIGLPISRPSLAVRRHFALTRRGQSGVIAAGRSDAG